MRICFSHPFLKVVSSKPLQRYYCFPRTSSMNESVANTALISPKNILSDVL